MYELNALEIEDVQGGGVGVVLVVLGAIAAVQPTIDAINDVMDGYEDHRKEID